MADSGSWKIIAMFLPRRVRLFSRPMPMRLSPFNMISPETLAVPSLCSPMMPRLVTLLPEPDSPTMPSVLPRSTLNEMPLTALTRPSSVGKWIFRSRTSRNPVGCPVVDVVADCLVTVDTSDSPSAAGSVVPDARVDDRVEDVDDEVGHDDEEGTDQGYADDDRQVLLVDRVDGELADPLEAERVLGEDRAAEQSAEVEPEDRD